MRKAIVMMLLAVVSSSAAAEWVQVDVNDNSTVYADRASIRKNGSMVKMWALFDLKVAQKIADGKSFLSSKQQTEFDCKDERRRTLYFSWHAGNMGGADVVFIGSDPDSWVPIPPDSMIGTLWKIACGKR